MRQNWISYGPRTQPLILKTNPTVLSWSLKKAYHWPSYFSPPVKVAFIVVESSQNDEKSLVVTHSKASHTHLLHTSLIMSTDPYCGIFSISHDTSYLRQSLH